MSIPLAVWFTREKSVGLISWWSVSDCLASGPIVRARQKNSLCKLLGNSSRCDKREVLDVSSRPVSEIYIVVPLLVTLTALQGHCCMKHYLRKLKSVLLGELLSGQAQLCVVVKYLDSVMTIMLAFFLSFFLSFFLRDNVDNPISKNWLLSVVLQVIYRLSSVLGCVQIQKLVKGSCCLVGSVGGGKFRLIHWTRVFIPDLITAFRGKSGNLNWVRLQQQPQGSATQSEQSMWCV